MSAREQAAAAAAAVAAALTLSATPALALEGKLVETTAPSSNVPGPVPIVIYTPPGYDPARKEPYPLIIELHGGGGSDQDMKRMAVLLDQAIDRHLIPPVVSVMPSAGRSFYMDYKDGSQKWEAFIVTDLLGYMRANTNVVKARQGTFITGISMGGWGRSESP